MPSRRALFLARKNYFVLSRVLLRKHLCSDEGIGRLRVGFRSQSVQFEPFFGNSFMQKLPLKVSQLGCQQTAISFEITLMGTNTGSLLVRHRRPPQTEFWFL